MRLGGVGEFEGEVLAGAGKVDDGGDTNGGWGCATVAVDGEGGANVVDPPAAAAPNAASCSSVFSVSAASSKLRINTFTQSNQIKSISIPSNQIHRNCRRASKLALHPK